MDHKIRLKLLKEFKKGNTFKTLQQNIALKRRRLFSPWSIMTGTIGNNDGNAQIARITNSTNQSERSS